MMQVRNPSKQFVVVLLLVALFTALTSDSIFADDFKKEPVTVSLSDPTSGGFAVILSADQVKHKKVTFEVTNIGSFPHELIVIKHNGDAGNLPLDSEGRVDEDAVEIVARTPVLAGGDSATLALKLKKGQYALICNIGTHYVRGMFTDFQVGK